MYIGFCRGTAWHGEPVAAELCAESRQTESIACSKLVERDGVQVTGRATDCLLTGRRHRYPDPHTRSRDEDTPSRSRERCHRPPCQHCQGPLANDPERGRSAPYEQGYRREQGRTKMIRNHIHMIILHVIYGDMSLCICNKHVYMYIYIYIYNNNAVC